MKIDWQKLDQEKIKYQFDKIRTKLDLVKLLCDINIKLYGDKFLPITLELVDKYSDFDIKKMRYQKFEIFKKNGTKRIIHSPQKGLRFILRSLNILLQQIDQPHRTAMGFVPGKSIVDNALLHKSHKYVFNIDLKDFFYSFDFNRVKMALMYKPFNLNGEKRNLAIWLAHLCTHPIEINGNIKAVLPQGSPVSPVLTNIMCKRLDRRLNGLAKKFDAVYTRYADDITFSSNNDIFNKEEFVDELQRIIAIDNTLEINGQKVIMGPELKINTKKTRLQRSDFRQEVTGLVVNEKLNVRRKYINNIRMWLYFWEKYGYEKANGFFRKDYIREKGHLKKGKANLVNVLDGKLSFLKMVKGENDSTYQKLMLRYNNLVDKDDFFKNM